MVLEMGKICQDWVRAHPKSVALYEQARKVSPGGGHHCMQPRKWAIPLEYGAGPFFSAKAKGTRIWDVDGHEYLEFYAHAALFLGHAHPVIVEAIQEQVALGCQPWDFLELQIRHCELISKMIPSVEMVSFCNSGTEADMGAIKIARVYTGRKKLVQVSGWVGWPDQLLSPNLSAGIPEEVYANTVIVPARDTEAVKKAVKEHKPAAVISVLAGSRSESYEAQKEYVKTVREICDDNDVLLIVDEVITWPRLARGGAQEYLGVEADITTMGKMVGGGIGGSGAIGGRSDVMEATDPFGKYAPKFAVTAGTFSGNALNMAAGYAGCSYIDRAGGRLNRYANRLGDRIREGWNDIIDKHDIPAVTTGVGSQMNLKFLTADPETEAKKFEMWLLTYANILRYSNVYTVHTYDEADDLVTATEEFMRKEFLE